MFQKIKGWREKKKEQKLQQKFLLHPISYSVMEKLRKILNTKKTYIGKFLSNESKEKLTVEIMVKVARVLMADDPIMENRIYLCNWVSHMAQFGVLVMPLAPNKDYTGLRGKPGITGELRNHLLKLAEKDKYLNKFVWSSTVDLSVGTYEENLFEMYLLQSCIGEVNVHIANLLRCWLGDYHTDKEKDWFEKFLEIEFAWYESIYRNTIGLDDVLEIQSGMGVLAALKYSVFKDLILNGEQYPNYNWESKFKQVELA